MKRRAFITLLGGTVAWPLAARAQQAERVRHIGLLTNKAADDTQSRAEASAFEGALQERGWTLGGNLKIDYRWGAGDTSRYPAYAADLVATDPVSRGLVASLSRPGGNATGFLLFEFGISGKWLELLKEISPHVTRAVVIRDPSVFSGVGELAAIQAMAPSLRVDLSPVDARDVAGIERALTDFARQPNGGVIVTLG